MDITVLVDLSSLGVCLFVWSFVSIWFESQRIVLAALELTRQSS